MSQQITLSDSWRLNYRNNPYLGHLNDSDLRQRFADISSNIVNVSEKGLISFEPIEGRNPSWLELWTHIQEEYLRRVGGLPPGLLDESFLPGFSNDDHRIRAAKFCANTPFSVGANVAKFGKSKFLKSFFERGELMIRPASSYNDPSLNSAIKDDELSIYSQSPPANIRMEVFDHKTGKSKGTMNPIGGMIKKTINTDFLVYCMSGRLSPRLFLDFEADSCLIAKDFKAFGTRIKDQMAKALPGFSFGAVQITYVDPLFANIGAISPESSKHFRFSYQTELRFLWFPPKPTTKLEAININVGSLMDICSYFELGDK